MGDWSGDRRPLMGFTAKRLGTLGLPARSVPVPIGHASIIIVFIVPLLLCLVLCHLFIYWLPLSATRCSSSLTRDRFYGPVQPAHRRPQGFNMGSDQDSLLFGTRIRKHGLFVLSLSYIFHHYFSISSGISRTLPAGHCANAHARVATHGMTRSAPSTRAAAVRTPRARARTPLKQRKRFC